MAKENDMIAEGMTGVSPSGEPMNTGAGTAVDAAGMVADGSDATPAKKSRKESYMEGFKKKHPDWQDDDEEGFYGALTDDNAALEEEMNGYKSREDEINSALDGSVLNAALLVDAMDGTPIPLSILERYPDEMRAWIDDPQNMDAVKKAFEDHAARIEENKKLKVEADKNLEETNKVIDDMIANGEIKDDDEANTLLEFLGKIAVGLMQNHVEKEWLTAAKNALNYDNDVAAAKTQGEINGRNQKITAQRMDNQRGGNTHSGLGSSNAGQRLSARETREATGSGVKRDMWGGMKVNKLN